MIDMTGTFPLFQKGEIVPVLDLNSFKSNRGLGVFTFSVSTVPIGTNVHGLWSKDLLFDAVANDPVYAAYIETYEGVYLEVVYGITDLFLPGRLAHTKVAKESFIALLDLLSEEETYKLAENDAKWFKKVVSPILTDEIRAYVMGTQIHLLGFKPELKTEIEKEYGVRPYQENDTLIFDFLCNYYSDDAPYVDPGKLAVVVQNLQKGSLHKISL